MELCRYNIQNYDRTIKILAQHTDERESKKAHEQLKTETVFVFVLGFFLRKCRKKPKTKYGLKYEECKNVITDKKRIFLTKQTHTQKTEK